MADASGSLSANELKILAAAWISCTDPPKPDYEVIAKMCGYKNAGSASVMFGHVRRKLAAAAKGTTEDSPVTKSAPIKKKRAADTTIDDGEQPKKRGRKPKAKAIKEETVDEPEHSDDAEEEKTPDNSAGDIVVKKEDVQANIDSDQSGLLQEAMSSAD